MLRVELGARRRDWEKRIYDEGLVYWRTELPDGRTRSYWREGQFYSFTLPEIKQINEDAQTLFTMLEEAAEFVLANPAYLKAMGIPAFAYEAIHSSWNLERQGANGGLESYGSVYGRYDVVYGGDSSLDPRDAQDAIDQLYPEMGRIRLYEFNADTPTGLVESALSQWNYFKETGQGVDQWNSIYEDLVEAWRRNLTHVEAVLGHRPRIIHFAYSKADGSGEDAMNVSCLEQACRDAGYQTQVILIDDIHYDEMSGLFFESKDEEGRFGPHLDVVFKLYPWEMMLREEFGEPTVRNMMRLFRAIENNEQGVRGTFWIEPLYKALWSNKGILPILWMLYGNDPEKSRLLIPAWFEDDLPASVTSYVRKPLLSREGANLTVIENGEVISQTGGDYGAEGYICQAYVPPPAFIGDDENGNAVNCHPVLGIWMVDGMPAGLCIRDSYSVITDNLSFFVPHLIEEVETRNERVTQACS